MEAPVENLEELAMLNEQIPSRQIRDFSANEVQPVLENERYESDINPDVPSKDWLLRYMYHHIGNI